MNKITKIVLFIGLVGIFALTSCAAEENPSPTAQATIPEAIEDKGESQSITDLSYLRTTYVGAAHSTRAIVNVLPRPSEDWMVDSIQIGENIGNYSEPHAPYTLTVFYEAAHDDFITTSPPQHFPDMMSELEENAGTLFDLIENLRAVTFSFRFPMLRESEDEEQSFIEYHWSVSRSGEFSLHPAHTFDRTIIQIDLASTIYLSAWDSFHEIDYNFARGNIFEHLIMTERPEQGIAGDSLVIWIDNLVTDFHLIEIGHDFSEDGYIQTFVNDILLTIPELHPDKPIILQSYFGVGTFPHSGIAFTDHDGSRRHFSIVQDQSGYGDPYRLIEFEQPDIS